jgi:hypothetical protein
MQHSRHRERAAQSPGRYHHGGLHRVPPDVRRSGGDKEDRLVDDLAHLPGRDFALKVNGMARPTNLSASAFELCATVTRPTPFTIRHCAGTRPDHSRTALRFWGRDRAVSAEARRGRRGSTPAALEVERPNLRPPPPPEPEPELRGMFGQLLTLHGAAAAAAGEPMERTPIEKALYENRTRSRSWRKLQHQNRAEPKARPTGYGRAAALAATRTRSQWGLDQQPSAPSSTWSASEIGML